MALKRAREDGFRKLKNTTELLVKGCTGAQPKQRVMTTRLKNVKTAVEGLEKVHYDSMR